MAKGPRSPQRSEQEIINEVFCAPYVSVNLGSSSAFNIKDGIGKIRSFTCYNAASGNRFALLFNTSAVPSDGYTPDDMFLLPAYSQVVIGTDYFGQYGLEYEGGISFGFSVSANVMVSGVAANCTSFIKTI